MCPANYFSNVIAQNATANTEETVRAEKSRSARNSAGTGQQTTCLETRFYIYIRTRYNQAALRRAVNGQNVALLEPVQLRSFRTVSPICSSEKSAAQTGELVVFFLAFAVWFGIRTKVGNLNLTNSSQAKLYSNKFP